MEWSRTRCDTETGIEIVEDGKESGLELEGNPVCAHQADQRNEDDESGVKPVNMLVPVTPGDWELGDMGLLQVVLGRPQRLVVIGAVREGRGGNGPGIVLGGGSHC